MKALSILTVLFTIIFTLTSSPCLADSKVVPGSRTIMFCNVDDAPRALPYLVIKFFSVKDEDSKAVDRIQENINKVMSKTGGVKTDDDLKQLFHAISSELDAILKVGIEGEVLLSFPSIKRRDLHFKHE